MVPSLLSALAGCGPRDEVEGGCELAADNALRATCAFDGPVELSFDPAGPVVDGASVRRMLPETTYAWTARSGDAELQGTLTTGALPASLELDVVHTGAEHPDDVMFLVNCPDGEGLRPSAVAVDGGGRIVWYQELAADLPASETPVVGLTWSPDRTILAVLERRRIREFDLDGNLLSDLEAADGTEQVVHHDVFRRDGRTYAITAQEVTSEGNDWIVDGVVAFEADGTRRFDWDLAEIATPSGLPAPGGIYWVDGFPGADDWAHANGLWVAEDGDVVLSLHTFSTVLRIEGEPSDPAFGTPVWVLDGSGTSPWPTTFAVGDPDGLTGDDVFGHQHHPELLDGNVLQFFDNGDDFAGPARALRLRLDEGAGTAAIVGSWPLDDVCPIEGGVFELSNGNVLATCSLLSTFTELDTTTGAEVGATTATCPGEALEILPRGIPVEL